jgi:Ca2+-binding EF-hand superfamily protein
MAEYEPYVAFQRIDRDHNDFVTASEIIDFLRDNKTYGVSFDEAMYLVKFFDSDEDAKLSYTE